MHDSDFNSCYQPSGLSNSSLPSKNRNSLLTARQDTSRAHSPSTAHCFLEEINREAFPQPRSSVKLRLQHEEATQRLTLDEPDKVRRGSCNGFTVTKMIMCGIEDARFVLPYFHHIKHHEVRALKNWLCEKMYVKRSGGISRMEKVLHCIQLLQTGCRYESLAVLFSRSPRQIKDSCHEVMAGLLRLHCDTVNVDEATDHVVRMYMPLWGLWTQYGATKGKAALYYGFRLSQVAQVLGALNLYIGRWRMQGGFAVDGPMFSWGGVFVIQMAKREGNCSSELRILGVDDDDDDGTSTIRSVAIASRRFEID
ncbi:uncharacterized protein K460DRAFT_362141 [Cucurbitaria berberidis CBS 394.84]|uniref:Uncharacterized protein n=1 Tax=Cucurbitaria berberidis CBS 394.84 TaxID=1168544 RepID=A0A9P4GU96_9PLEO|nr:uncharacterized protein K460DRAFT_362141 [Cucurbitaria berberidis CBS 394.84]KAF1851394.1 hypothetical protein K460DRAFT_362141 [Cucurbitaria berberidis CBS 394.84]